jgi:hypothetical protein
MAVAPGVSISTKGMSSIFTVIMEQFPSSEVGKVTYV